MEPVLFAKALEGDEDDEDTLSDRASPLAGELSATEELENHLSELSTITVRAPSPWAECSSG